MRMETFTFTQSTVLDRKALIGIYEQYSPGLFRYAYRLLGDQDTAEECAAETFSRFLDSLRRNPEGPNNVQAYLYRMAHNWITDYYRRQPPPSEPLNDDIQAVQDDGPAAVLGEQMERERVREALFRLPPEQRQVIMLRFMEEQTHEDVASVMGKSVDATRAMQYRALTALRKMLLEAEKV